jgi:peptide/nickel transport system ATP-binding protein
LLSVVPEQDRVDQQILTGEAPDSAHIPTGCRFHPRCPLYQSGEAERLGIFDACTSVDPALVDGAACHAVHR